MTFTPQIASTNQTLQIGAESTPGTAVAANKRVDCYAFKFGAKGDFKKTTGTGRKYPSVQQLNSEWAEGSFDGSLDFNGILYVLAGALGIVTPTAHGSSATAKDWVYDAILSGSRQPQTYTFEQGESATRAHKFAYGLINKYGYKFSRKDSSISGSVLAQRVSDGITMTSSPTPVPLLPMTGQEFNLYIDSTSAALGTTQITNNLSGEFSMDGIYGPAWYVNRSNSSFSSHVDLTPNASFKFAVAADANGMASLGDMRTGVTKYVRVEAVGGVVDNSQTVTITGGPTGGTFTLTYKGQTTSNIAYNAASSAVQTALQGLSTIGSGNATVSGSAGGPYTVTFAGTLATDTTALTASGAGLTGGTSPSVTVTQSQIYNTFWHDMAIKIGQPSEWGDSDGIYMIEWDCGIFEDGTWGHSHMTTVTNLLTAL